MNKTLAYQVWTKPLGVGRHAVFVVSNASAPVDVHVKVGDVSKVFEKEAASVRDLYEGKAAGTVAAGGVWSVAGLLPHDSRFVVLAVKRGR